VCVCVRERERERERESNELKHDPRIYAPFINMIKHLIIKSV